MNSHTSLCTSSYLWSMNGPPRLDDNKVQSHVEQLNFANRIMLVNAIIYTTNTNIFMS